MLYLIDLLLQVESKLYCNQWSVPFLLSRSVQCSQQNTATAKVLVLDELLSVFILLFGRFFEELGESFQSHIVTIEISKL